MSLHVFTKKAALQRLASREVQFEECIYLSSDYSSFISLRRAFLEKDKIRLPGAIFHQKLAQLQADYLGLFAQINEDCQSLSFWGTHTGSRNSLAFPLLRNLVFLAIAKEVASLKDSQRRVLIFESKATLQTFVTWCQGHKIIVSVEITAGDVWAPMRQRVAHVVHGAHFLAKSAVTWLWGRALRKQPLMAEPPEGRVLLRTWITAGSLTDDLKFKNRNFGFLPDFLSKKGKEVWVLPMYFNLNRSIFKQMSLMARSGLKFIFKEQYLLPQDYLRILGRGINETRRRFKGYVLHGDDVSPLVQEAHLKTCFYPELLDFNLSEPLIFRLKRRNITFQKFIYPIENNVVEKPFNIAVKRHFPEAILLGFQHTVWVKEQLGGVLHFKERHFHPLPDKIICCGPKYVELLAHLGFPRDRLLVGANLRYSEMHQIINSASVNHQKDAIIAIVLNAFWEESAELLDQTKKALSSIVDNSSISRVVIKLHPLLNESAVCDYLQEIKFPLYEFTNDNVLSLAAKSRAVVMPSASVSNLEIIVSGIPLLRISSGANFDLDPLWDEYPLFPQAQNPEDLGRLIEKALVLTSEERVQLLQYGQKILSSYFTPVTEQALEVFL